MPTSSLPFEKQYPLLSEAGKRMLDRLNEHPDAPHYNHTCGNRLTQQGLEQTRQFDSLIQSEPPGWTEGELPDWVLPFARECIETTPYYRAYGGLTSGFHDLPTFNRSDLAKAPWLFVPDTADLEELIVYGTSGTTGHPIDIPCSPAVSHMYLPLLKAALRLWNVEWEGGQDRVACLLVCSQQTTYTLTSVSPFLGDAGWAKINLNSAGWPSPESVVRFIDDCDPEILTGDPLAFADLAKLPLQINPKALISSAMAFLPGLREQLERHFGCPVIDLYSMTESGPIAALDPAGRGHLLLQPRLFVEILDPSGVPCLPGQMGEITLTGGFNPYFPLLRYRTNDYARLILHGRMPVLVDLQGRPPTLFRTTTGRWINNVDLNNVLRPFPLAQFHLHQNSDSSLVLEIRGEVDQTALLSALHGIFGQGQAIKISPLISTKLSEGKKLQYTSDLDFKDELPGYGKSAVKK